jgi:pimeloyl-ACP methyl ester carboxylesterase
MKLTGYTRYWIQGVVFLALSATQSSWGDPKDFYYQRFLSQGSSGDSQFFTLNTPASDKVQAGTYEQRVNPHDPKDSRTFEQRYYFDDTYAAGPDSPVFFYLCGEATCQPSSLGGAIAEHAKTHHAYLISLEHRYYGKSQPFAQLTTENLAYLTSDNALLDAAAFEEFAQQKYRLTGKWVVFGGSYPGALSAYYREAFPDLVVGSLASSAPVRPEANFEDYDRHVTEVVGPDCAAQLRKVTAQIEGVLDNPTALAALKAKFQAQMMTDNDDFLYLVADMGAMAAQYGYKDHLCTLLKGDDPLSGLAQFTLEIYKSWKMNALSDSVEGATSLNPDDYASDVGLRQWFYQSCTEYGFWQNAYHDAAYSVRSARINPTYHLGICRRLFGIETPVDTSHIEKTFYQPLLKAPVSGIFFTNGSDDPWSELSITVDNANNVNPALTLKTIAGGAHCDDLGSSTSIDSTDLKAARSELDTLIDQWTTGSKPNTQRDRWLGKTDVNWQDWQMPGLGD